MATRWYQKLVRDNIPNIIRKNGQAPSVRRMGVREYRLALQDTLLGEVQEFLRADKKSALIEELADVEEVLASLRKSLGVKASDIARVQKQKPKEKGGFDKRIFLESIS